LAQDSDEPAAPPSAAQPSAAQPAAAPPSAAQPSAAQPTAAEQARKLDKQAIDLAGQEKWPEALAVYQRAAELAPHPLRLYNVGFCERALGRSTRARQMFRLALQRRDEMPEQVRGLAVQWLAEYDKKLPRVTVTMAEPSLRLAVDGRPLLREGSSEPPLMVAGSREPGPPEPAPAVSFDLLIDPGSHVFVITRDGTSSTAVSAVFTEGQKTIIELKMEEAPVVTPPPTFIPGPTIVRDAPASRAGMWTAFTVGGAAAAVAVVTGAIALDLRLELDDVCQPRSQCPLDREDDIDRMVATANTATVATAVGAAGIGLGVVLYFLNRPSDDVVTASPRGLAIRF